MTEVATFEIIPTRRWRARAPGFFCNQFNATKDRKSPTKKNSEMKTARL
jgi:hypothetical protein